MHRTKFAALLLGLALTAAADDEATQPRLPVANVVTATPTVAIGGMLGPGAAEALVAQGFTRVIDLRNPEEGTADEAATLSSLGLQYINFPTGGTAPSSDRLAEFTALLDAAPEQRTLLHCASGNRAGMMWGLYRREQGIPLDQILSELHGVVTKEPLLDIVRTWSPPPHETR